MRRLIAALAGCALAVASLAAVAGPASADSSHSYSFLVTNPDGSPARWDPCTTIHYATNLSEAPPGALSIIQGVVSQLQALTHDTFTWDGPVGEVVSNERPVYNPYIYGQRYSSILIDWAHTYETDYLPGGSTVGVGGATWVAYTGQPRVYVTGQVGIDTDRSARLSSAQLTDLVLHEMGHEMGLGHTPDTSQVMYPVVSPLTSYAQGDRNGLGLVGAYYGGCLAYPPPF